MDRSRNRCRALSRPDPLVGADARAGDGARTERAQLLGARSVLRRRHEAIRDRLGDVDSRPFSRRPTPRAAHVARARRPSLYYVTTKDFKTYSPAALLYDGGFCAIDGTIAKRGDTYFLVMKDETFFPPARNLRVASSKHATGPVGPASPSFTARDTEGRRSSTPATTGTSYYDEYTRGHYGAVRTRDFEHWEPFSDSLKTPRGIRTGRRSSCRNRFSTG